MSGRKPNDPSGVSATKAQAYAPAVIVLVLAITSIIIGVFLLMTVDNLGTYSKLVRKVTSANGLKGSISGYALSLASTSSGLLKGPGLQTASNEDVTKNYTLQGFDNNNNPGNAITNSDSILDASEKLTLLNHSKLVALISSTGPIIDTDTVFQSASKIKGQVENWRQKFAITGATLYPASDFVLLTTNIVGSNIIPANTIMPGLTYNILTQGTVKATTVMGGSDDETLEFQVRLNENSLGSILSIPRHTYSTTTFWPFTLSFSLSFLSPILLSLTSNLVVYVPTTGIAVVNLSSKTSGMMNATYTGSIGNTISIYGRTNDSTGTGHTNSKLTYVINNIACFPTIGVMHS